MPTAVADGISTYYEEHGSGPPLIMMGAGSFDSTVERWDTGIWKDIRPMETFGEHFTCIPYDRREAGRSSGRVEKITYRSYADQVQGLVERLGHRQVYIVGVCMGASVALAFAVAYPDSVAGMVLHHPAGGAVWGLESRYRFDVHYAFAREHGLDAVVALSRETGRFGYGQEAKPGPWMRPIVNDPEFARAFAGQDLKAYLALAGMLGRALFDRDTVPGAEPEELMRLDIPALITPGRDRFHAASAAWYLEECLPSNEFWNVPVEDQTAERVTDRTLSFLCNLAGIAR